jgi:hypothetical protein
MEKDLVEDFKPKTSLGKKLIELKKKYIKSGGKLLNDKEFDEYLRKLKNEGDDIGYNHR